MPSPTSTSNFFPRHIWRLIFLDFCVLHDCNLGINIMSLIMCSQTTLSNICNGRCVISHLCFRDIKEFANYLMPLNFHWSYFLHFCAMLYTSVQLYSTTGNCYIVNSALWDELWTGWISSWFWNRIPKLLRRSNMISTLIAWQTI